MTTDAGITGYGQPLSYGHRRLVIAAVEELTGYLVGRDPFRIEDHWQVLYRTSYARAMPILVGALSGWRWRCGTSPARRSASRCGGCSAGPCAIACASTPDAASRDRPVSWSIRASRR